MLPNRPPKFRINQKVVCIDDSFKKLRNTSFGNQLNYPKEGLIYTVTHIIWFAHIKKYGLILLEVKNKNINEFVRNSDANFPPSWNEDNFAPLDEMDNMTYAIEELKELINQESLTLTN
jgi:hypothetical protein